MRDEQITSQWPESCQKKPAAKKIAFSACQLDGPFIAQADPSAKAQVTLAVRARVLSSGMCCARQQWPWNFNVAPHAIQRRASSAAPQIKDSAPGPHEAQPSQIRGTLVDGEGLDEVHEEEPGSAARVDKGEAGRSYLSTMLISLNSSASNWSTFRG
eukprot:Skav227005  [mRNA]  locus=scaffold969:34210:34680:+ [translate_table: standard]